VVVDASVLVELVIDGRHRRGADLLLDRYAAAPGLTLVSAAHGLVEALSALRRLVRLGEISGREGEEAVDWLRAMDLVLDATGPRARRIWELREAMSAYDAAYAAAAEVFGVPLVTVDQRLRRACRAAGIDAISLDKLTGP
jgi:predicted nucleic acid-binding protein